MALKDQITDDMKTAMRAKDSARLGTIRLLLSACKQKEVDERVTLDNAAVLAIIEKLVKQRKDSISAFTTAQRQDLVDKEAAELLVLEAYLPQRMDAAQVQAEIRALVDCLSAELGRKAGASDMGRVMGLAKTRLAGTGPLSAAPSSTALTLATSEDDV